MKTRFPKKTNMICLVCLRESQNSFNIFDSGSLNLNAVAIISKHLWFEPKQNDFLSSNICLVCWNNIKKFNKFYTQVESAHKLCDSVNIKCNSEQADLINDVKLEDAIDVKEQNVLSLDITITPNNDIECSSDDEKSKTENESQMPTQIVETQIEQNKKLTNKSRRKKKNIESVLTSTDVDLKISKFMVLTCHLCSEPLKNFASLRSHFRSEHDRSGYAFCCNKKMFKRCRLSDHIDTHLNPDIFKCSDCDKVFNSREYLQLHIKNKHDEEKISHQCNQCPKKFAWKAMLDAHKYIHTPKENWNIKCDDCGKTFATKYFLAAHKHSVHYAKDNLKICHICGKNVSNKMFKRHQKTHSGIDEPRVQCEICGTWLKNQRYLKIHLENHQESIFDHICAVCGKNSPNRRALAKHIRDTHTENRIHKCNICDKSFKRRLLLTQHITTHTGEFLYNCPYCTKSFTYDSTFHVHKKKEHPIEFEEERTKRGAKKTLKKNKSIEKELIGTEINEITTFKLDENKFTQLFKVVESRDETQYFNN